MYKLKSIAGRAVAYASAAAMLGGIVSAALPGIAYADALNPLTERSLRLTSSAPGYQYTDGSGNATYAPPGSGPNGQKTGEIFTFRVSTDSSASGTNAPIKAFTFQYCVAAAGVCMAPGNNTGNALSTPTPDRGNDTTTTSDLNVNYSSAVQGTDFDIFVGNMSTPLAPSGWTLTTSNEEDHPTTQTGKNNFITLANASSTIQPTAGQQVKIVFYADNDDYITNPGEGSFFVKINTYNSELTANHLPATDDYIIDGGVTVANVMTDSIWITTKVLETMSFSVGTVLPDTQNIAPQVHGPCDAIEDNEIIQLGDSDQEYSLSPFEAFDAHSYWRLSSNSSAGASVYYSGATLNNTVGDNIDPIGTTAEVSSPGQEQFGLGFDSAADTLSAAMQNLISTDPANYSAPTLAPLVAENVYGGTTGSGLPGAGPGATGTINGGSPSANFAFDPNALSEAALLAAFNTDVVRCSTGKMRYLANIAPFTPAGVYTTKINYLAAPQY